PVVIVILLTFVAADHQPANALVGQQCLVHGKIGQIGLDGNAFLRGERLARLQCVERRGGVARIIGEGVGRQTRWQMVTHSTTLLSTPGVAPAVEAVNRGSLPRVACSNRVANGAWRPRAARRPDRMVT